MAGRATIADVKALLQARVEPLVRELFPAARVSGGYASLSSSRPGAEGGSFVVWIKGSSPGAWKDYASGEKGDVIDLIAYAQGAPHPYSSDDRKKALDFARGWLGLDSGQPIDLARARDAANRRAQERAQTQAERLELQRKRAFKMWLNARPSLLDTPAERYLASRGILLRELARLEADLRFHPGLEWWMGASRRPDGSRIPGPVFPAMIAAMRDAHGAVRAVHCTFLAPDGSGKADVAKTKLIWPACGGLVIRLAKGASGLTPEEATEQGARGICMVSEGIETGLSMAAGRPDLRCWAAGSLAGLAAVPLLPCVSGWIVGADNDWGLAARQGLDRALAALRAHAPAAVATSPVGKDFNDCLRADGGPD